MKCRHYFFVILGLVVVTGCSGDKSYAKKLILDAFQGSTAVKFGPFTRFDETRACYEVSFKNFEGHEKIAHISLRKDKADNLQWSDWTTTKSLNECRDAFE